MTPQETQKLKRRIVNFVHQYASLSQLQQIADLLGISEFTHAAKLEIQDLKKDVKQLIGGEE